MTRAFCCSIALALAACSNQLVPAPTGGRISGTVTYGGLANQAFARPGLVVSAFFTYPPSGPPHAFATLDTPPGAFTMPYELRNLPVGKFRIVATAVDLAVPQVTGPSDDPMGGYPSVCALTTATADVPVTADVPAGNINIALFDHGGAGDPCKLDNGTCPPAGRAALLIELVSAQPLVAPDRVAYALFPSPTSAPIDFDAVTAVTTVAFPRTITRRELTPGSYIVFVCRDAGGNNLMGCGSEDLSLYYMDKTPLPLLVDTITRVRFDLDTLSTSLTSITTRTAEGCP